VRSAHDCADGGFAVALAECCFDTAGLGCAVTIAGADSMTALYSESASRVIVSVAASDEAAVLARASAAGVPARRIGTTGGDRIRIAVDGSIAIDVGVADAERVWSSSIEKYFQRAVA